MKLKRHINFISETVDIIKHEGNMTLYKVDGKDLYNAKDNIELKNPDVLNNKLLCKFDNHFNFTLKVNDIGLTTLEGLPEKYAYAVQCHNNNLTDLKYSPRRIERDFDCSSNILSSLNGAPYSCESFYCQFNNELTDLKGAPKQVINVFDVGFCNNLTSLEGMPNGVSNIDLIGCSNLTSLEGLPEKFGTINLKGTGVYSLIDLAFDTSLDSIEWQGSKISKIEYDFFINEALHRSVNEDNYYNFLISYIKENIDDYEPNEYSNLILPQEFYDTLDDDMKNMFKSIKTVAKYNL